TEDVVALTIQRRAADLNEPGVVGPAIEAEPAQPRGIELAGSRGCWGDGCLLVEGPYRRVVLQFHDDGPFGEEVIPPRLLVLLSPHHQSGDEAATELPATHSQLRTPFPDNAGPRAVSFKHEDIPSAMVPVQSEHSVPKTALRLTIRIGRERIVYA